MKKDIRNLDEQGKLHGKQIDYYSNGDIWFIYNHHHGNAHGYHAWFNDNDGINDKTYCNMGKLIYNEDHLNKKQIEIKI